MKLNDLLTGNELIIDVEQKMFVNNVEQLKKVLEFFFNFESEIDMKLTINYNQIEFKSLGKTEQKIVVFDEQEQIITSVDEIINLIK